MKRHSSELTASEAAAKVRTGKLSPLDLVDAALERIDQLD